MPKKTNGAEKKNETLPVKVSKELRATLEEIAANHDRPLGYVVRELTLRGLDLYYEDGKLSNKEIKLVKPKQ